MNVPHELSASAFMTTRPSPAIATTSIRMIAKVVVMPLTLFISSLAIAARDFPSVPPSHSAPVCRSLWRVVAKVR